MTVGHKIAGARLEDLEQSFAQRPAARVLLRSFVTSSKISGHIAPRMHKIGRAHVGTPVTPIPRMPSSAWKKKTVDSLLMPQARSHKPTARARGGNNSGGLDEDDA